MIKIQPLRWCSLVDCSLITQGLPSPGEPASAPVVVILERATGVRARANEWLPHYLAPEEMKRLEQYKRPQDRDLFLLGRGGLRLLLGAWLGIRPQELQIAQNQYGKPSLHRSFGCDRWDSHGDLGPYHPHFSLSHAGDLVLFAFHTQRSVGIDVEVNRPSMKIGEGFRLMLTQGDCARSATRGEDVPIGRLLPAWCRAEARLKALGEGFDRLPELLQEAIDGRGPAGWEVLVPAGYYAHVSLCDAKDEAAAAFSC